jgi:hypothetical protein
MCGSVCRPQLTAVDASVEECNTVGASELRNEDSDVLGELTLRRWLCADVSPKRQETPPSQETEIFNYEAHSKGHSTVTLNEYCLNLFYRKLRKKEIIIF